jgi:hypothetical protein
VLFQTDTGARLIGHPHGSPVSSWVPILMFTVLVLSRRGRQRFEKRNSQAYRSAVLA